MFSPFFYIPAIRKDAWNDFVPHPIVRMTKQRREDVRTFLFSMLKNERYNKVLEMKHHHISIPSNVELFSVYVEAVKLFYISRNLSLEKSLISSKTRFSSGVLVYTTVLSPYPTDEKGNVSPFTCAWNCHFCPNEKGIARSYRSGEPAVQRGMQNNWDAVMQVRDRHFSYASNGLINVFEYPTVKGQFIVEGGTWNSFPPWYRRKFITELFYASNTIYDDEIRPMRSLEEEQKINETCVGIRIVGLSIETRPDCVNDAFLRESREFGVTLVQMGVQTLNDDVLRLNNRGCYNRHTISAIRSLLNANFKVQIHLMPDMCGSNIELDKAVFSEFFSNPIYYCDYLKVYPCVVLPDTKIKEWYDDGKYVPYGTDSRKMIDVLSHMTDEIIKNRCYHLRKERLERDFLVSDISAGCSDMALADNLMQDCVLKNKRCICIRCREAGKSIFKRTNQRLEEKAEMVIRRRQASEGTEVFLSFENSNRTTIFGFLRLRLTDSPSKAFPELSGCAMIREVHIYGTSTVVGKERDGGSSQHIGMGRKLISKAEEIALYEGYTKVSVIAGVGVKEYYRRLGYIDVGSFLIKRI